VPEDLQATALWALMGSVDCWPLAITYTRHLGVSPDRHPASAVTGGRYPPLE
jgi:hypothetical protein